MRHLQQISWPALALLALACATDSDGSDTSSTENSSTTTVSAPTQSSTPTATATDTATSPPSTTTGTPPTTPSVPTTTTTPTTVPTPSTTGTPTTSASVPDPTPTASTTTAPTESSSPDTSSAPTGDPPVSSTSDDGAGGDPNTDSSTPPVSSDPSTGGGGSDGPAESAGCSAGSLSAGDETLTIDVGGESREYVLHVPNGYDGSKPVPLIIDFHGLGGSGPSERTGSPYPAQTDADGVIMAFPSGKSGPSGPGWNVGPCCVANVDDVAFARAMVDAIEEKGCIDTQRIYAVGFSMGGGMSHYLACHAADIFAAVAPAAFDLLEENEPECEPVRPISVVSFRGTSDPIVAYDGGYSAVVSGMPITFLGAKATFAKWAEINGCTGSPSAEDGNGCSTYSECQDGTEVVLCTKQGGGHEAGNASVAWPILKKHTLP